jgi:ERCC4-related helicase
MFATTDEDASQMSGNLADMEAAWAKDFSYAGMRKEHFDRHYRSRAFAARELSEEIMRGGRPILCAETGSGKTIIAMLAQSLLGWRTLFLAPSKILLVQHRTFLSCEMGYRHASRLIDGDTPQRERVWDDENDRYVFATPQVVLSELSRGVDVLAKFRLGVFDEGHHARGKEPYVLLGSTLRERHIAYFGMSATIGSDEEDISALVAVMRYSRVCWHFAVRPPRYEEYVFIPLSPEQKRAEENGFLPLEKRLRSELLKMVVSMRVRVPSWRDGPLRSGDLDRITYEFETSRSDLRVRALVQLAAYKKLLYAYRVFITESYENFLAYIEFLKTRRRASDKYLLADGTFRRIIATARHYRDNHPKELYLKHVLVREARHKKRSIVFFGDKTTAARAADILSRDGVPSAVILGGRAMSREEQLETIYRFRNGDVLALMATSVIEEGVSVPEVSLIVNYHLPQEPRSRRQRAGRTARMNPGNVLHLIMEHDFDRATFYAVHRKVRQLESDERALASNERHLQVQFPLFDS